MVFSTSSFGFLSGQSTLNPAIKYTFSMVPSSRVHTTPEFGCPKVFPYTTGRKRLEIRCFESFSPRMYSTSLCLSESLLCCFTDCLEMIFIRMVGIMLKHCHRLVTRGQPKASSIYQVGHLSRIAVS